MNYSLFIAKRYFRSKKKRNFISVISNISMGSVAVGTMALIVVLSVFNGLEDLLRSLYGTFDPDIKIEAARGKSFTRSDSLIHAISTTPGVASVVEVIEDYAYLRYRNAEMTVRLKGVSDSFLEQGRLVDAMVEGNLKFREGKKTFGVVGRGIQYALNINIMDEFEPLKLHYVKDLRMGVTDPTRLINQKNLEVGGVFAIEKNFDETYVFTSLEFARELLNYGDRRTALELSIEDKFRISGVQEALRDQLGAEYKILNSDEQHASLLKAVRIEKLFVYVIFIFIIAIASFNIFFSLSMLAIEKKKDISVMFAMGANNSMIRRIFLFEGAIIAFTGALIGLLLGALLCILQQEYGLVGMGMESAVILSYPVRMQATDFLLTAFFIVLITIVASYRPAVIAARYNNKENLY